MQHQQWELGYSNINFKVEFPLFTTYFGKSSHMDSLPSTPPLTIRQTVIMSLWDALCDLVSFVQFKNVKNNHGEVLFLLKLLQVTHLHGCFLSFLNCTNGNKSCRASEQLNKVLKQMKSQKSYIRF